MHSAAALLLAALVQQVPTVTLPLADARSAEGFTSIFAVHELPDGRVLMTDNLDNAIRVVDLDRGTVRELGRHGEGPREYRSATTILRGTGDTILVTDNRLRRFVRIVDGEIVGTSPHADILRRQSSFSPPLADRQLDMYFQIESFEFHGDRIVENDAHVLRWRRGTDRLDTLATLPVTSHAPRDNRGYNPFRFRSAWALAPDGAVAVISADPYRVTWVRGNDTVTGPTLPYTRIDIDDEERDAERIAFSTRGRGSTLTFTNEDGRPSRSVSPELRSRLPDDIFPPFKPPFTVRRVLVSPAAELWIPRVGRWNDDTSIIDVVDRNGHLVRHVRIPARQRIVGFGRTAVYVATKDDVDLQWLERIPLH